MKLMIAGGGTGGHLFPGVALAGAWMQHAVAPEVFFVGTEHGLEKRVVPAAGYRLLTIAQRGLKNRGLWAAVKAVFSLPRSIAQSLLLVWRERPAVAVGVGGYAAGPAILAAWLLGVPTLILEPNAMPGLTNRLLARIARKIVSPYDRARAYFGTRKLVQAGIPVRPAIVHALEKQEARVRGEGTSVLIFGGSQGARALNQAAMQAVPGWMRDHGVSVVHQTGAKNDAEVRAAYARAGVSVDVREFIDDMAAAYQSCDLVVCRSGGSSLAELALVGRPAVLVPLPSAADDHQTKNAQAFADAGAGVLLRQSELTAARLSEVVLSILAEPARLAAMSRAARALGDPRAAERLCALCLELAGVPSSSAKENAGGRP